MAPDDSWSFQDWYDQHKDDLNLGRRFRYRRDEAYRQRVLDSNKKSRDAKRQKRISKRRARGVVKSSPTESVEFKTVEMDGVEYYTIGKLAQECDRSIQTIRGWEKKGLIPKTPHRTLRGDRLYTEEQIDDIVTELEAQGRLKDVVRPPTRLDYKVRWADGREEDVQLFQVGVLAAACERSIVTLDQMSKKGALPDTPLVYGSLGRRLYTGPMIQIVREAFIAHGGEVRGPDSHQSFHDLVLQGWDEIGVLGAEVIG